MKKNLVKLNPQELAEKLKVALKEFGYFADDDGLEYFDTVTVPILTASVGTLLQAERAAMADKAAHEADMDDHYGLASDIRKLATESDRSALSAVVQRETAKLRELLRRCLHADDLKLSLEARIEHGLVSQLEKDIMAALK